MVLTPEMTDQALAFPVTIKPLRLPPVRPEQPNSMMLMQTITELLYPRSTTNEATPLDTLAPRMLSLLNGEALGLAGADGSSLSWSWPTDAPSWAADASKMAHLRETLGVQIERDAAGTWLTCHTCEPRFGNGMVAWLFHRGPHTWDAEVQAAWPIVAQTLVRSLAQQAPAALATARLRHNLERAAVLTSRLSHDFGNYLTGILGFTELSLGQAPAGSLSQRYLQEVLQSARQGAAWLRRLAWYCRRSDQAVWPSELNSVLEATRLAVQKDGSWNLAIPTDLPLLAVDATSLQATLEELARNGIAASNGADLTITARSVELTNAECRALLGSARPGRLVEITVADAGPGFSAEARAKVFHEPFYSTNPRQRGLGLLIAYGIARCFGGAVQLVPADEGPGGRMRLFFPAVPVPGERRTDARVLLVHPERLLVESMRKLLEGLGCHVTAAPHAMVALSLYQSAEQAFDLVLAESTLPQLSGFDLARRILDRDGRARFVFLHTSPSFHGSLEPELLKRFALLRWPITPDAFLDAVQAALKK